MAQSRKRGIKSSAQDNFLAPSTPTIDSVTDVGTSRAYNDGAVDVAFTLPANSPAATSYTVLSSGSHTATGSSSPIRVTGLSSGTSYTFQVKATNASGESSYSSASSSVTATTVPDTPGAPSASSPSAGNDSISWTAPNNGGKSITNYHWESNDSKSGDTGTSTSATVSQEQGTSQQYRVYATNANGNSNYSSYSNSVTTTFSFAPFSVFGFSPFGVFGFSPFGVFGFSPFGVFGFSPFGVFGFSPGGGCIDQDTLITVVGPNNSKEYKMAKAIMAGDWIWTANFDELPPDQNGILQMSTPTLTNLQLVQTQIVNIIPSEKAVTVYFNGDTTKRFSLEENMIVKRDGMWTLQQSAVVVPGDVFLEPAADGSFVEVPVTSTDMINEDRMVYKFDAEPVDALIAGNIVVHNPKGGFNTRNLMTETL